MSAGWSVRRAFGPVGLLVGLCLLGGCHHKQVQPLVLPQATPVPLATDATPDQPVLEQPKQKLPEVPVASAASKPKRIRRKATPKPAAQAASGVTLPASVGAENAAAPPASQSAGGQEMTTASEQRTAGTEAAAAAGNTNREIAAIGSLTGGAEQDPRVRQQVMEMISANERRLGALPIETVRSQAALVSKVRTFQRDAQQALDSGDAEGARTLAMKGKLLLDDLSKPTS